MGSSELARGLGFSSAATTVLVDRLERAGHLARVRDATDRRRVTVTATPGAHAMLSRAWSPMIQDLDEACRSLPESEQGFTRDVLGLLTAVMTRSGHP